jgi:LPS export ABC transporter protein LptC
MTRSLLASLTLLLLLGCGRDSTSPSADADAFDLPADQVAYEIEYRMTNRGVFVALLNSDTAYVFEDSRRWDLVGVRVTFYDDQGREAGRLTSARGDYDTASGTFIAREDVVLISEGPEGERLLETEELYYLIRDDRLWTERPFTLREAGRTSRGNSFRTDAKLQRWEVTGIQTGGSVGEGGITF